MSAFTVSKNHIDYLLSAAFRYGLNGRTVRAEGKALPLDSMSDNVGRILWEENYKSVNYRYNREEPTPRYESRMVPTDPITALKQIDCYEYQSNEHDGWETSLAHEFCRMLRAACIASLPGYSDAPWGVK